MKRFFVIVVTAIFLFPWSGMAQNQKPETIVNQVIEHCVQTGDSPCAVGIDKRTITIDNRVFEVNEKVITLLDQHFRDFKQSFNTEEKQRFNNLLKPLKRIEKKLDEIKAVMEALRSTLHIKDKVIERLLRTLDENEVALEDRESKFREMAHKYKEIEARLAKRDETDTFAKNAKEHLGEGDLEGVEALLHQSLEQNLKVFTGRRKAAADAFELANIRELQLDYRGAFSLYEQAATLAPEESYYLNRFGLILDTLGEYDRAIEFYSKALKIDLKVFGDHHPKVAIRYNNLGVAWRAKGAYDKAIEFYFKALKVDLKVFGDQHPKVATSYNNLGAAWQAKGAYDKAIEFHSKALKIFLKVLGGQHPKVAASYNNLGVSWCSKGAHDKAIEFYSKALKIDLKVFGDHHPNVAIAYNNLGLSWYSKGTYDKAIEFYSKALKIDLKVFGDQHPNVATSYNSLGAAWQAKGAYDKAIEFYAKALAIYELRLGRDHPNTQAVQKNLEAVQSR